MPQYFAALKKEHDCCRNSLQAGLKLLFVYQESYRIDGCF